VLDGDKKQKQVPRSAYPICDGAPQRSARDDNSKFSFDTPIVGAHQAIADEYNDACRRGEACVGGCECGREMKSRSRSLASPTPSAMGPQSAPLGMTTLIGKEMTE
jgi:hypothetical protein